MGLIPGVGEIADGANALIYSLRGDYVNASLSAAAMIPFVGMAATGGKYANKFFQAYKKMEKFKGTGLMQIHHRIPLSCRMCLN